MPKKTSTLIAVLLGFLFTQSILMARETKPTPTATPAHEPIFMKWAVIGGMNYFHSGVKVNDYESLEAIILPLNDPEATRLLKKSKESNDSGVAFLVGGGILTVGGLVAVLVDPNTNPNYNYIDTQQAIGLSAALVGLVGDYIGIFRLEDSKTEQFSAVQQYNAVVHGEELPPMSFRQPAFKTELLTFKF